MEYCCFTGHRPDKLPWKNDESDFRCAKLKKDLQETVLSLVNEGVHNFICGMALGADIYFAECVLKLKEEFPFVTLECALPCKNQAKFWSFKDKVRYDNIINKADSTTLLSQTYTHYCMLNRNRYMVDKSDIVIALWNGSAIGGTYFTVKYAREQDKKLTVLSLKDYSNS